MTGPLVGVSVSVVNDDGSLSVRIWRVSRAFADGLAAAMGEPYAEQLQTAEVVRRCADVILETPIVWGRGTEGADSP